MRRAQNNIFKRVAFLAAIIAMILMGTVRPAAADEMIYQKALNAGVAIFEPGPNGHLDGAGACIDVQQGLVVTAGHVVGDNTTVTVFPALLYSNGRPITQLSYYMAHKELAVVGYVIRRDRSRDLAIVRLARVPAGLQALPLATAEPDHGEAIFAIGHSGVDDDDTMWDYRDGSVRQVCHKDLMTAEGHITAFMIETTIASNHGDSGGPVLNSRGELAAVTITHHPNDNEFDPGQHIGFCTDVTEIRAMLRELNLKIGGGVMANAAGAQVATPPIVPAAVPAALPAPMPAAAAQAAEPVPASTAWVESANLTFDNTQPGQSMVGVHANAHVWGVRGVPCELVCTACDENHKPLRYSNGAPVQMTQALMPAYDKTLYLADRDNLVMHFPVAAVQQFVGSRPFGFLVSIRVTATGQWLTKQAFISMYPAAPQAVAGVRQ